MDTHTTQDPGVSWLWVEVSLKTAHCKSNELIRIQVEEFDLGSTDLKLGVTHFGENKV